MRSVEEDKGARVKCIDSQELVLLSHNFYQLHCRSTTASTVIESVTKIGENIMIVE